MMVRYEGREKLAGEARGSGGISGHLFIICVAESADSDGLTGLKMLVLVVT
jgi:hypothetical protein